MAATSGRREPKRIVIIGAGIIGTSTAYYLSRHPLWDSGLYSVTVLEATSIASGASGKGGGFIANWATPKCLAPLSFKLHNELAEEHDGDKIWGYRNVHAAEVSLLGQDDKDKATKSKFESGANAPAALDWLRSGSIQNYDEIGTPSNSGQVNPYIFTRTLARLAEEKGVIFNIGASATNINIDETTGTVKSASFTKDGATDTIDATDILVSAGPWTPTILPIVPLLTPCGHSVIVKPTRPLSAYILFPDIKPAPDSSIDKLLSPEIYPRPGDKLHHFDTVYASGPDDYDADLPANSDKVELVEKKCDNVLTALGSVSEEIGDGVVVARQACFKAQIRKHEENEEVGPMVGPVSIEGLWLATGHDEWGIQNAPGTGLAMAEMIIDGASRSVDCSSLDPKHFIKTSETL